MTRRGFSLLEVMVAVAILGLALTVILSAQSGLAASNYRAANMGYAIHAGRCKMTETEEKLLRLGYPEIDDVETDSPCCGDESNSRFKCDQKTERIVLPNPPGAGLEDGGLSLGADGGLGGAAENLANSGGLNLDGGITTVASDVSMMGGASGMLNMLMGMVYPALKEMMEASIRRITITVRWKEGIHERELVLTQYVTNPMQGGFMQGMPGGIPGAPGVAGGTGDPSGTGVGTTGGSTGTIGGGSTGTSGATK